MTTQVRARAHSAGGQPRKDGGGRPSPGRTRFTGVLLILLSVIPAVLCYLMFAAKLPSDRERYQDYRAAEPCSPRTAQTERDCLSTWQNTVVKTATDHSGKVDSYKATVKNEGAWRGVVEFEHKRPLFERLEPGDRVTATVWRGDIVVLDKQGVQQNTTDAPQDEVQGDAVLGTFLGLVAAQMLVFGAARLVRPRAYERFTDSYRAFFVVAFFVCLVAGILTLWIAVPWRFVPPAISVVCVAVMTYALVRRRPTPRV